MTAPGRKVPKGGLVGVLSAAPQEGEGGLVVARHAADAAAPAAERGDDEPHLRPAARGSRSPAALVELCRLVPVMCSAALAVLVVVAARAVLAGVGFVVAALLAGPVLLAAGVVAAA